MNDSHPQKQFLIMKVVAVTLTAFVFAILAYHSYRHELEFTKTKRHEIPALGPATARPNGPDLEPYFKGHDFKGVVVHINVWASWCAPCLSELPMLEKLQAEHQGQYQLVLINADQSPPAIQMAQATQLKLAPSALALYDNPIQQHARELNQQLNVEALPYHIIIDQSGRVAATFYARVDLKPEKFKTLLNDLINEPQ